MTDKIKGSLSGAKSIDPIDILRSDEGYKHFKNDREVMVGKTMTAKESEQMPTSIWACGVYNDIGAWSIDTDYMEDESPIEYTLKHNNPDYYVIPKSDVQGDVLSPIDCLDAIQNKALYGNIAEIIKEEFNRELETIRLALIAQSDMVTIPRDVLEGIIDTIEGNIDCLNNINEFSCVEGWLVEIHKAINDVLNHKKAGE